MKSSKMNFLYKIGFILMFVCLALFVAAIIIILVAEMNTLGVLMAVAGVFLCLIAIILTMFSKPKKPKQKMNYNSDTEIYNIETTQLPHEEAAPGDSYGADGANQEFEK